MTSRRLALGALTLGLAAPFAGSPFRAARGRIAVDDLVTAIDSGADHVAPLTLARWIRARKPRLRVVDVRTPAEFEEYAIPTAENVPLAALVRTSFAPQDTVVLYSEGGAHAGQAWVLLRAIGVREVYFISGGLVDWYQDVMTPTLSADATPEQQRAFEAVAELSRYFGGVPQLATASERTSQLPSCVRGAAPQRFANIRRRGC